LEKKRDNDLLNYKKRLDDEYNKEEAEYKKEEKMNQISSKIKEDIIQYTTKNGLSLCEDIDIYTLQRYMELILENKKIHFEPIVSITSLEPDNQKESTQQDTQTEQQKLAIVENDIERIKLKMIRKLGLAALWEEYIDFTYEHKQIKKKKLVSMLYNMKDCSTNVDINILLNAYTDDKILELQNKIDKGHDKNTRLTNMIKDKYILSEYSKKLNIILENKKKIREIQNRIDDYKKTKLDETIMLIGNYKYKELCDVDKK
jgi:hypothetical protein